MAKWKVKSKTGGSLMGEISYDQHGSEFKIYQDEKPFLEQAKLDRDLAAEGLLKRDVGYKKFASIPDIVAIDIAEKYGLDIHDPLMMNDSEKMKRFKYIIKTEYAYLMSY